MKKIVLFVLSVACLGLADKSITASGTPIVATATPVTQALGAATVLTLAAGAGTWAIGHFGGANTIGAGAALGLGWIGGYVTAAAIEALGSAWLPACVAANPMVAPIAVGAVVMGLMLLVRKSLLFGPSKETEEYGTLLLKLGIGMAGLSTLSYVYNASPYELIVRRK